MTARPSTGDATLDTGGDPGARSVTADNDQTDAVAATMAVTGDARGGIGRKKFEVCVDFRVAAVATTDSVADAGREWAVSRGGPGRWLRVLGGPRGLLHVLMMENPGRLLRVRDLGGPDGASRQLPAPNSPAVLRLPPCQSGGHQRALPGVFRAIVTVEETGSRALRRQSNEVVLTEASGRAASDAG